MISKEDAHKIIEQHQIKDLDKVRINKLSKLPQALKHLGMLILEESESEDSERDWEKRERCKKELAELLKSKKNQWQGKDFQVLQAIFGEMAEYIRLAWHLQTKLAYQANWYRRSFRSPNNPLQTFEKKLDWLMILPNQLIYDFKIADYARYLGYFGGYYDNYSHLLAAVIDSGTAEGDAVFKILLDTIYDRDEIACVSRNGIKALLLSNKEDGYQAVEKLLISAQRQEGLRQSVLESLDETHPSALKRMMKLIIDNKLARFSSVVRAVGVWFGFGWESEREKTIYKVLENGWYFLENPETIPTALDNPDNLIVFTALWAKGVDDIEQTFPLVEKLLENKNVEKKLLGLYFLQQTSIHSEMQRLALPLLEYDNLKVASLVLTNIATISEQDYPDIFTKLEALLQRVPQKGVSYPAQAFSWLSLHIKPDDIFKLMLNVTRKNNPERIIPYIQQMGIDNRQSAAGMLFELKNYTPAIRETVFKMLGDRGEYVRQLAFKAVEKLDLAENEILQVEALLVKKAASLRKGCIKALLRQNDALLLESAKRLLFAKKAPQRLAGLDILLQMKKAERTTEAVGELASEFGTKISAKEQILLDDILSETKEELSFNNALGLINPNTLCHSPEPEQMIDLSVDLELVQQELQKLDNLFEKNKDYEYDIVEWSITSKVLIGNKFPKINELPQSYKNAKEAFAKLPLSEVWKKWWEESQLDIFDITKLSIGSYESYNYESSPHWIQELIRKHYVGAIVDNFHYKQQITTLLKWIKATLFSEQVIDFLLNATETVFASIPRSELNSKIGRKGYYGEDETWRESSSLSHWEKIVIGTYNDKLERVHWTDKQKIRLWHLLNWKYHSAKKKHGIIQPPLRLYLDAVKLGEASESDIYDKIIRSKKAMAELTVPKRSQLFEQYDFLEPILIQCRDRVLEIELKRGDSNTLVTPLAAGIKSVPGIAYLIKILNALGNDNLPRMYNYENNKNGVLADLLKVSHPETSDTQAEFDRAVKEAKIAEQRLVEVAMYAPVWVTFVEKYLRWKGLETAVWWFHAHTMGDGYAVKKKWEKNISGYTPLSAEDLIDGAVDVDWFKQAYKSLGKSRWNSVYAAAKYTSDSNGHRRSQIFADSMLGINGIKHTRQKITEKRDKDYVRTLGLVPLSKRNPQQDVLKRYQLTNKFLKESKQFGSQRQTSEALAVRIGLENLARTAGYLDPIRLTWAMEIQEIQEILTKAKSLTLDETCISLVIDEQGKTQLSVKKAGKQLKSIPAKYRKNIAVKKLHEHKKTLANQYSRARKSLEEAMNRGDEFSVAEIQALSQHPLVSPMLKNLVLVVANEKSLKMGFPDASWQALISPNDECYTFAEDDKIRIAHCVDLEKGGNWSEYQHHCFVNQGIQPFKQIFRELYLVTADEKAEKSVSRRYAGHQVQPKKAVALLKNRGWRIDYEDYETGLQKVYHKENMVATIYAMADWFTPSDVEAPTLETVQFLDRKTWKNVPFDKIEARIFSELMRDIDLVVSVAHAGGVDPEASHSTIEMRSVLIDETTKLLGFDNLKLQKNHAIISGKIGNYSVHLGSGVVHRQPGGYISILPVHSSHRGRIFLPFADDDPKTAEIISKILLLVKDNEIKDPTILRQLQG